MRMTNPKFEYSFGPLLAISDILILYFFPFLLYIFLMVKWENIYIQEPYIYKILAKQNKIRKEKLIIIRRIRLLDLGLAYTINLIFRTFSPDKHDWLRSLPNHIGLNVHRYNTSALNWKLIKVKRSKTNCSQNSQQPRH